MQRTKIINFLKCLSKHEFKEFGKFVRSPFHNNRKDVIRYYDILKLYYPEFDQGDLTSEMLFKKLYAGKKYDPNVIILLNSYLYNLGKEFLTFIDLREDNFFSRYHFLKSLDKHFADGLFEKEYRETEDFLNSENLNNAYFVQKGLLELLKINFNLKRNKQEKTCKSSIEYGNYSIYSFITDLVVTYHGLLANKNSFNYDFTDSTTAHFIKNFNFEGFMNDLDLNKIENCDYILYYYYLFMSNYYPDNINYFAKLKEYSFREFVKLNNSEKFSRFNYLIDYCIYKMELGHLEFLRESFNLYTEALDRKIFHTDPDDKNIGLMFFRNFVTIGLAAKEYDYVENFISQYSDGISGEMKSDLLELSLAMLDYEKRNYDKALERISRVSNLFPLFRLSTKFILAKIYYDTNQYESFLSLIDTYRHYLKNDKIIPRHTLNAHTLFLNYTSRLAKFKSSGNNEGLYELKKEIKENAGVDFRHKLWLNEKAEELEKL